MSKEQIAVFVAEHQWDYRCGFLSCCLGQLTLKFRPVFGFTAALLEMIPFVGLIFTVSNRVGAAMWAHGMKMRHSLDYIGANI